MYNSQEDAVIFVLMQHILNIPHLSFVMDDIKIRALSTLTPSGTDT